MLLISAPLIFAQATGPGGTPIWVILIIVLLLLVLFLWGVTNSSGIRGKDTDEAGEHDSGQNDHPPEEKGHEEEVTGTAVAAESAEQNEVGNSQST